MDCISRYKRESQVDRGYDDNDAEEDYEEEADGDEYSAYFTAIGSVGDNNDDEPYEDDALDYKDSDDCYETRNKNVAFKLCLSHLRQGCH